MAERTRALAIAAALSCAAPVAQAAVTISSGTTANMSCANGVCAPTAKKAVLNVGDLETMLSSGNVEVTTTGSGVQADDIVINTPLSWSSTSSLALDSFESITVDEPVTINGLSDLSIATNDGGSGGVFSFGAKGNVTFANLSSQLTINGAAYTLVGDITTLAANVAANSSGNYALANDYDAKKDGTYGNSPIPTEFSGVFEGLGNTISSLSINGNGGSSGFLGFFAEIDSAGVVNDFALRKLRIQGSGVHVGGLVGFNIGAINGAFVSGSVESNREQSGFGSAIGILVGSNAGPIARSGATGAVTSAEGSAAGGLVGGGDGTITQSYADCTVTAGSKSDVGGLVGGNLAPTLQSYAMGSVTDDTGSYVGGLMGESAASSTIAQSYSTTALKNVGHRNPDAGGLIGIDYTQAGSNSSDYWNTTTSHVRQLGKGAGTPFHDPGITGLTTTQLQSGLPAGFNPTVWAEDSKINGGLPYLIANPPRKK